MQSLYFDVNNNDAIKGFKACIHPFRARSDKFWFATSALHFEQRAKTEMV